MVVHSDYLSTSVSLVDPGELKLLRDGLIHSGSRDPVLSTALSGDVVLASTPHPKGLITLIDRYPNAVITLVDPHRGEVVGQLSVATGFASNPHDLAYLEHGRAYLTRYDTNPSPSPEPGDLDEGDDLLLLDLDPSGGLGILKRIPMGEQASTILDAKLQARPDRLVLDRGLAWVSQGCISLDFRQGGSGVIVAVDTQSDTVRHRVEIPQGSNCSGLAVEPGRGAMWVVCSGVFQERAKQHLARSGLARIDLEAEQPVLSAWLPASELNGRPLGPELAGGLGGWLFVVSMGELEPSLPDRLLAVRGTSCETMVLHEAGAFSLGGLLVEPGGARLWVGVADPRAPLLRFFDLQAGHPPRPLGQLDSNPSVGLPPRSLGVYGASGKVPYGREVADAGAAPGRDGALPDGGEPPLSELPTPDEVVSVRYGAGAGHGQDRMPGLVLDTPEPGDSASSSTDALSLGDGGEIVLRFVQTEVLDGPGPDLRIYENVFLSRDPDDPYAEVAVVSVSEDGTDWHTFPFDYRPGGTSVLERFQGFAGLSIEGDEFDLARLGLSHASYLRIGDAGAAGEPDTRVLDMEGEFLDDPGNICCPGSSQGFDLEGVVALHWRELR